jgi:hypothetical protein
MAGRPSKYTPEIADTICELTATTSKSLRSICNELNLSVSAVLDWLASGKYQEFTDKYARAKTMQADAMFEEIIEIADDEAKDLLDGEFGQQGNAAAVQRAKLRVDARKWAASKLAPKKYGDKIEHTGNVDVQITGMKIV